MNFVCVCVCMYVCVRVCVRVRVRVRVLEGLCVCDVREAQESAVGTELRESV